MSILIIFGLLTLLLGSILLLIEAFSEDVLWGLAVLLFPGFASLVFILIHWHRSKMPFFVLLLGGAMLFAGTWGS